MTNPENNSRYVMAPRILLRAILFPLAGISLALLLFQSIWFAYVIGALFLLWTTKQVRAQQSLESIDSYKEAVNSLRRAEPSKREILEAASYRIGGNVLGYLAAYTFLFVIVIIPLVYHLHTKTNINLLSRDAEKYIKSIIDDSDDVKYAPIDY